MKKPFPSVMHARYRIDGPSPFPGYSKVRDIFHNKDLIARELPKMPRIEQSLSLWSRMSHPCFVQVFRFLTSERSYIAIMRPLEEDAEPLRALKDKKPRSSDVARIFTHLLNAYHFLSSQNLFIPYLDLSKIFFSPTHPVRILGHEASLPSDSPRPDDQMTTLDIRYNAPEMINRQSRTPKSDVYHLGALFYHFLSGRVPKPYEPYEPLSNRKRRLRKAWDELLEAMTQQEPAARPDWETLWREARAGLGGEEATGAPPGPVWMGVEDRRTLETLKDSLVKAKTRPQAIALQVFPGREKLQRLAPFARFAEERGYFVFHSWTSERETRCFKIINDFLGMLREGVVRHINRPDLEAELSPLSEWQSAEELIAKWKTLLKRVFRNIAPRYGAGIALMIEDIQHLDRGSVETLGYLFHWLADVPFILAITGNTFAHPHFHELAEAWPYDWRYESTPPLSEERLNALLWLQGDPASQAAMNREALLETNREEVLTFYWLEDRAHQPGAFHRHLDFIWRCCHAKERLILNVLSCAKRPLSQEDIKDAFALRGIGRRLERLERFRLLRGRSGRGWVIAVPAVSQFCRERLDPSDLKHIRTRLYGHELSLDKPDLTHTTYLALKLEGEAAMAPYQRKLADAIFGRFELDPLWRLERVFQEEAPPSFRVFAALAKLLRGLPAERAGLDHEPGLAEFAAAARRRQKGDAVAVMEAYATAAGKRKAALGLKSHALTLAAEWAAFSGDKLSVGKFWRRFQSLDLRGCEPTARQMWAARFAAALATVGRRPDFEEAVSLLAGAPACLREWVDAIKAWVSGDFKDASELAQSALQELAAGFDLNWRGSAYKLLGNSLHRVNRPEDAIQAYRAAKDCFHQTRNQPELDSIRFNLAVTENLAGRFASSEHRFQPLYEDARQKDDADSQCRIAYNLMVCALFRNETARFERWSREHRRLARRIKSAEERARGLTIGLHAALTRSKGQNEDCAAELRVLLKRFEPDPLMAGEAEAALRLADLALGRKDAPPATVPELTRWRHRFIDMLRGQDERGFPELLEDIGSGYFEACHFFLLRCAVEQRLLPKKHVNEYLVESFERYIAESGADYSEFLNKHFAHRRGMGDVPRQAWEQALQLFESLRWSQPKADGLKTELTQSLRSIWPFAQWGACQRNGQGWRALREVDAADPPFEVLDHLRRLNLKRLDSPLVTTLILPDPHEIKSLLLLPVGDGESGRLAWFVNERAAAHDLGNHYQPLFRFYAKMFEYLLHRASAFQAVAGAAPDGDNDPDERAFGIIGRSQRLREAIQKIKRFAPSNLNIYIWGESGTGKELAARAIHQASNRAQKPFRALNCSHFPDNLVESELFGHVRGAYTGASADKAGLLELVDGGTLFLDEIGDINGKVQSLLLRVFQEGEFSRIGENRIRKVDIRFVAATNKNLHDMIDRGLFRDDLYFRMVEEEIHLPALRQRLEDLPLLARHFVSKHESGRKLTFTSDFFDRMRAYEWPGNVRELESYVRRLLVHWRDRDQFTRRECLPFLREDAPVMDRELTLSQYERANRARLLKERLARYGGNRTQTALSLGISRQQLLNLISKYELR